MPHELSFAQDGRAEMFYVGETPWHGLGTRLDEPATYVEAIQEAHLDWKVEARPVYYPGKLPGNEAIVEAPNHRVIVRTDTGAALSIMSDRYQIVQNEEAWDWADSILGKGGAHYHTAGALRDGRVQWILAERPGKIEIVPGDTLDPFILLTNSHDGSLPLQVHPTSIRTICANTVEAALARGKSYVSIRHTASVHRRMQDAEKALRMGDEQFKVMTQGAQLLSRTRMTLWQMGEFTQRLLGINPDAKHKVNAHTEAAESMINELFVVGRGQDIPGVNNTAWAAYNAVTEYVDYYSRVQKIGDEPQDGLFARDRRLHRSWFGRGHDVRTEAWNLLHNFQGKGDRAFEYVPAEKKEEVAVIS